MQIARALISVSNKAGVVELAKGLLELGIEVLSTGGTAKFLKENKIKVKEMSEVTGFPEILDGRVKSLHPKVHGGILAVRGNKKHMQELEKLGIQPIDLVVVNLYPFEETIERTGAIEEVIENIDIGGPAMLRSAAKNYRDVAVVVDPRDYAQVLKELGENDRRLGEGTRERLAIKAFSYTARLDTIISNHLMEKFGIDELPDILNLSYKKIQDLRYGENPHQKAAIYRARKPHGIVGAKQLQGKQLSFNNILDLDVAWEIVREFEEPTAVIVKHGNPCGVVSAKSILEAYKRAHACDPASAYGSIVAVNGKIDEAVAEEITSTFVEAVISPDYQKAALDVFKQKKDLRVMELPETAERKLQLREVTGGALVQEKDAMLLRPGEIKVVTKKKPSEREMEDLIFAWKVVKHVKSNAILVAKEKQAIGVGAGQMSRVDSTEIAIKKAGDRVRGAVLASDGFVSFEDSIHKAADAGITAVIQPGGSIHDEEVIQAADKRKIAMVITGVRHFKH